MNEKGVPVSKSEPNGIIVFCESCGKKNRAPLQAAGKKGKCTQCGTFLIIPNEVPLIHARDDSPQKSEAPKATEPIPPQGVTVEVSTQKKAFAKRVFLYATCGTLVLICSVACLTALFYKTDREGSQEDEWTRNTVNEANQLWEEENQKDAVRKYQWVLNKIQGREKWEELINPKSVPLIYTRVIEYAYTHENGADGPNLIREAWDRKVKTSLTNFNAVRDWVLYSPGVDEGYTTEPHVPFEKFIRPSNLALRSIAEKAILKSLKAPSTASFPPINDPETRIELTKFRGYVLAWKVRSWVDAQNTFGAMIRTQYVAVVFFQEPNGWVVHIESTNP